MNQTMLQGRLAIFRINYKSDFIITLNSDAGWMTPFCIKFWTGAPSQAYFAGWDGTTYTNCAPVQGDPTKLEVQFDDHHLPIGELKYQIGYHFTVADFPTTVEDEVLNQERVVISHDGQDEKVLLDFNGETAPDIQFSLPAYANEAQRIANEEQRIAHEAIRIVNEESRIAAETTRQQNEEQRIAQETARVQEFARLKRESESATSDATAAATLANTKAQLAADKAALAQSAADLANAKALLAEYKAALAASAAQLANDKSALAQQKAEYAQTQGTYAKNQGDYAKQQGNYAKDQGDTALADHLRAEADHETAASDHTRAESDHSTASSDHTQASTDHSTATSDHSTAAADHTQAGNDHTRAESDHSTAASDHTTAGNDHTRAESDHTRAESDHAAVEVYVDSLGAYDISAAHAVGGVLATYANLQAALGTNGANIPEGIRKGGMSVKFVQENAPSSDNNYVKFFCTAQNFTTDVTQWQGVDEEPVAGSNNLVESRGVAKIIYPIIGENKTGDKHHYYGNFKKGDLITFRISDAQNQVNFVEIYQDESYNTWESNSNGIYKHYISNDCVEIRFTSATSFNSSLGLSPLSLKYIFEDLSQTDAQLNDSIIELNDSIIDLKKCNGITKEGTRLNFHGTYKFGDLIVFKIENAAANVNCVEIYQDETYYSWDSVTNGEYEHIVIADSVEIRFTSTSSMKVTLGHIPFSLFEIYKNNIVPLETKTNNIESNVTALSKQAIGVKHTDVSRYLNSYDFNYVRGTIVRIRCKSAGQVNFVGMITSSSYDNLGPLCTTSSDELRTLVLEKDYAYLRFVATTQNTFTVEIYADVFPNLLNDVIHINSELSNLHGLRGKYISIIGDSISTIANGNTPYWTVKSIDVGNEIQAYVTWYDVYNTSDTSSPTNKSIGGITLTQEMIGTLQTFVPVEGDVGKQIGVALNNNPSYIKVWSQVFCEMTGAKILSNASWSGASMCDGQTGSYVLSHAFSPYTVGRCKNRDNEGNVITPDIIFIYRGTNDMTHGQGGQGYSVLDDYSLMDNGYPETDVNGNGKYSFRRAYYMTIKALRDAYPKAIIYCCTLNVFKRIIYDRFPTRNGLYSLPDMNNAIRDIANEMGCGIVEFDKDGITFENCYEEGYITDSATTPTHPNSKGHRVMGRKAVDDVTFTLVE